MQPTVFTIPGLGLPIKGYGLMMMIGFLGGIYLATRRAAKVKADPDLILSCSHYGQLFASADGGDWWVKLRKEFTEIRGMAWTPN